uniref:Uncharacterized protein n=1 Tax=Physcomitrium patens TaxID=3218 RepID=A0A2K1IEV3_PHYPA|nr:hypothetical protein PHYPA_029957 [Physcomitrium patens]
MSFSSPCMSALFRSSHCSSVTLYTFHSHPCLSWIRALLTYSYSAATSLDFLHGTRHSVTPRITGWADA